MSRLNEQVSRWCKTAAERACLSKSEIEELRDHLYLEIRRQQSLGENDEQAFELATAQLGGITDLSQEYAKNRRIGRMISAFANVPYGAKLLGAYLLAIGVLISAFHVVGIVELVLMGDDRPPQYANFTIIGFLGMVLWLWLPFVWGGIAGASLLRGRELGPATLFGLVALLAIQVPVFGAQPLPAFELSGGLQLTVLLGPAERLLDYQTLPDIHINSSARAPYYFGINLLALVAFLFTVARFVDYVRRNEARINAAEVLD